MWVFEPSDQFRRDAKRYGKDRARELAAVIANLNTVQKALDEGANPLKLPFGFIHVEQRGVVAIDQKGAPKDQKGGGRLAETRLYVYLESDTKTIHLIALGNKNTQKGDVKFAADYVDSLREQAQKQKKEGHGDG